jgi:hypothetical protein
MVDICLVGTTGDVYICFVDGCGRKEGPKPFAIELGNFWKDISRE